MGQALGTQENRSLNVELNIVPFIDLMSCLTAFLLVTAVWVDLSSLRNEPVGRGAGTDQTPEKPRLAILLEHDQILVASHPSGEARRLGAYDWTELESLLRELGGRTEVSEVDVAAASSSAHPIAYRDLITAMDVAVKAGYDRVGVADPRQLAH